MASEEYLYDESVGIYGHESHERLARAVVQDLIRYEETCEGEGLDYPPTKDEEFGVSSIVDSPGAKLGYGLVVASPDCSGLETMGGVFYLVDREDPSVKEEKKLAVARPETFTSNQDYLDEIEKLMQRFDKDELEVIMRMLGKMTTSVVTSRELQRSSDENAGSLSVAASMKRDAQIKRTTAILAKSAAVEPYVMSALHNYERPETRALTPISRLPEIQEVKHDDREHLMEWKSFTEEAGELLGAGHTNLHYEIDGKLYYIKLADEDGRLIGVQILCDDTGAWMSQLFDLRSPEADEAGRNDINPMWNRSDILATLRDGEIIDNEAYEYYRQLAERSLKLSLSKPKQPIQIENHLQKRPAA